jgi:hypothetical protein
MVKSENEPMPYQVIIRQLTGYVKAYKLLLMFTIFPMAGYPKFV